MNAVNTVLLEEIGVPRVVISRLAIEDDPIVLLRGRFDEDATLSLSFDRESGTIRGSSEFCSPYPPIEFVLTPDPAPYDIAFMDGAPADRVQILGLLHEMIRNIPYPVWEFLPDSPPSVAFIALDIPIEEGKKNALA